MLSTNFFTFLGHFIETNPTSVILIKQVEGSKAIAMFKDPTVKPLIESASHIYDSTVISSYF